MSLYLPYYGGKFYLLKKLLYLIPKHRCYVEVFGGGGRLLLNKEPSNIEVYNDIDNNIHNLFHVLATRYEDFMKRLEWVIYSRKEFEYCKRTENETEDPIEKAYCTYYLLLNSYGRKKTVFSISPVRGQVRQVYNNILNLKHIHNRLKNVIIENKSYEKILTMYDNENTFFYLDPPYLLKTRTGRVYKNEMTYEQHEQLLQLILNLKGKVLLSGYDNELYNKYLQEWTKETYTIKCCLCRKIATEKTEALWYNYKREEFLWM